MQVFKHLDSFVEAHPRDFVEDRRKFAQLLVAQVQISTNERFRSAVSMQQSEGEVRVFLSPKNH